jgi:hypothetical protein
MLISIDKESGLLGMAKFNLSSIDVRPKQMVASESYRFLMAIKTETCESMCYCF